MFSTAEQIKQNAFAAPALLKYAQMKQKDDEIFIGVGKCIQSIVLNVGLLFFVSCFILFINVLYFFHMFHSYRIF